jgi:hypothetical protein
MTTAAREGRAKEWLAANWRKFVPNNVEMLGCGHYDGGEVVQILATYSESECSRLASRVEELEKLIAKHCGCSHCNDSASGVTSASDSTEIRRSK